MNRLCTWDLKPPTLQQGRNEAAESRDLLLCEQDPRQRTPVR
jgi:hypothetical protein